MTSLSPSPPASRPNPTRARSAAAIAVLAALLASPALADSHAPGEAGASPQAEWDQDRMVILSDEFSKAANDVYSSIYKVQVGYTVGSGQEKAYYRMKDKVRVIKNEARHLSKALTDGKGREETRPMYDRMMVDIRDAREMAKQLFLTESVMDDIAKANDLLRQMSPYYGAQAGNAPAPS